MNTQGSEVRASDILEKISLDLLILRDMTEALSSALIYTTPILDEKLRKQMSYCASLGMAVEEIANRILRDFNDRQHLEILSLFDERAAA